ncbi:MAG: hypothetical protein GH150_04750 [Hadesarchaea archaeon]|nr:hypothetical protein [Hadesarchaea archaeon]
MAHRKFGLICHRCKLKLEVDNPRLILRSDSNLVDLRATKIRISTFQKVASRGVVVTGNLSRPSELRRRRGIEFKRKFALIRCKCKNHLIVRRGQQTRLCPRCGRRSWLWGYHVVLQSNDLKLLSKLRWGKGNYYRPDGFIPADKLLAHSSHTAEGSEARDYRSRSPKPKRVTELVAT